MKIAMYFNLPSGGAKRAVYEWTRRLSQRHTIDAFTLETADHAFCDIRSCVEHYFVYPFTTHRLFHSPFGRLNMLQRTRDLHNLGRLHRRIAAEIDAGGYDLIFAHSDLLTFIPILLQFSRLPSLYYLHEPFGSSYAHSYKRPYEKHKFYWSALNKIDPLLAMFKQTLRINRARSVHATTRLLANSEFTRDHIQRSYGVESTVCYYGVDTETFYPMPEIPKEDRVVSVGEMTPRKGFDFLVESLARIPADQRPQLSIASNFVSQEELEHVQGLAERHHVQLILLTHLTTDQLREEYNRARLCAYAPVTEPLGLVPLEAMACGTPVVGVAEGGVKETVRDGVSGLLVPRDRDQFAGALTGLLKDGERLARFQAQSRAYALDFWSWDQSVRSLEQQLQEIAHLGSGQAHGPGE
jgi:glycosyltransferase involved in cell wall biosynthesis